MDTESGRSYMWIAGFGALAAFLFLLNATTILSTNLGLYHDELWDQFPSVGMIRGHSIYKSQEIRISGRPLPLVTGPYQGALKTWISAPLLLLTGTSPRAILLLNVAFAMIFLLALYWALLPAIGRKWAWLVFAWPFLDANFLTTAPMDVGPSLFQYIFIGLALGALLRALKDFRLRHYWLLCFFSGCLLAQKLTVLPIAISFILAAGIIGAWSLRKHSVSSSRLQKLRQFVAVPALLALVPLLPHLIYFARAGLGPLFDSTQEGVRGPYFASLVTNFVFLRDMFNGVDWYQRNIIAFNSISEPPSLTMFTIALMSLSLCLFLIARRTRGNGRLALAAVALCIASFLLYPAFGGLNRPWHYFVLMPLIAGAAILAAAHLGSFCLECAGKFSRVLSSLFILGLAHFYGRRSRDSSPSWSRRSQGSVH